MSQEPITVTYSLEQILGEIKQELAKTNQKLDNLQKDVTDVKVGQARLEEKVDGLGKRMDIKRLLVAGF